MATGISFTPVSLAIRTGPRLMEYLQELKENAFPEPGIVTVGEAWGADPTRAEAYTAPETGPLSMVFQFEHMTLDQQGEKWDEKPLSLPQLKAVFARWQKTLHEKGWNSLFLNNHDLPRIVSRWGNDGRAKYGGRRRRSSSGRPSGSPAGLWADIQP